MSELKAKITEQGRMLKVKEISVKQCEKLNQEIQVGLTPELSTRPLTPPPPSYSCENDDNSGLQFLVSVSIT